MPGTSPTALKLLLEVQRRTYEGRFSLDLFILVVDCVIRLTGAGKGFLVIPAGPEKVDIRVARGSDRSELRHGERLVSKTIFYKCLDRKQTLFYVNPLDLPEFAEIASVGALKFRSIIVVPLEAHGVVQGAIVLHEWDRSEPFTANDARLAELVAGPASHALESFLQNHAIEKSITKRRSKTPANPFPRFIGRSEVMRRFLEKLAVIANSDGTVLITGETGTGKEVVARTIFENGRRAKGPWVTVNISAIPESLIEAELFGHERGAFTGADRSRAGLIEKAHGGTLFLDEVGELSLTVQAKLLRVLQEREVQRLGGGEPTKVEVRIIAATHRNLEQRVSEGLFRQDLLYRLKVLPIETPPLRAHRDDLPDLCEHFLNAVAEAEGKPAPKLAPDLVQAFREHSWPGNVRELASLMYRAVVLEKETVSRADLEFLPASAEPLTPRDMFVLSDRERALRVLAECDGNVSKAAKKLGIARSTFYDRYGEHLGGRS